ncbi:hypothetical protein AB0952_09320 [Streptomyces caniferus]|uniref:hypothetical protein n=1 Tax=Streptomyces caniferus TaxID=285557 RepID=UPI00345157D4
MSLRSLTTRADLPLAGNKNLAVRVTVLERGCVRYVVRTAHVRGTFVLIPEHLRGGSVLPSSLRVQFGDGMDICGYYEHRPDEPVIFGMRLHGWTDGIDPDHVSDGWFLGRYAASLRAGVHRQLTTTVRRRTEDVIRALVAHWRSLPRRQELLLAAARPTAEDLAMHEAELAAQAEGEVADLQGMRAAARRRLNVVTGIIRRRPRPVRATDPAPVRLSLVDRRNRPLGTITVREVAVNEDVAGTVVYEVHGARVHGRFTVGRNVYRPQPLPQGVHVAYGHARARYFEYERDHEPTVNGVRLDGGWDHSTTDDLTASTPDRLPAHVRLTRTTGHSAPAATARRAAAVLRILALHYLDRPDAGALRLAAAQDMAWKHLSDTRQALRDLRREQTAAERRARQHRAREQQYRALLVSALPGLDTALRPAA